MSNDRDLSGEIVAVTGACGDIGVTIVQAFLDRGAQVVAIDRVPLSERDQDGVHGAGANLVPLYADVSDEAAWIAIADEINARFGGVDTLVNNAGVEGVTVPMDQYPKEVFDQVLAVNITGVFLGMKHLMPLMAGRNGKIVNLASTAGLRGASGICAYIASKHAVIGLTRTAAVEWVQHNIRANCVCPGPVRGRMMSSIQSTAVDPTAEAARARREATIPMRRYCEPAEVAEIVTFLASDAARYVNGACYTVDGGITAG